MTTPDGTKHWDKLDTVSSAPGYGDATLCITLHTGQAIEVNLRRDDVHDLARDLKEIIRYDRNLDFGGNTQPGRWVS